MPALEAITPRVRIRHVRSVHQQHAPSPITVVDPMNLALAVNVIRARIVQTKRAGAGSYVFIDGNLTAYVVSELHSIAPKWVRERFGWLVGFYAPRRRDGSMRNPDGTPYLAATDAGLTEDIGQHLVDLGVVV